MRSPCSSSSLGRASWQVVEEGVYSSFLSKGVVLCLAAYTCYLSLIMCCPPFANREERGKTFVPFDFVSLLLFHSALGCAFASTSVARCERLDWRDEEQRGRTVAAEFAPIAPLLFGSRFGAHHPPRVLAGERPASPAARGRGVAPQALPPDRVQTQSNRTRLAAFRPAALLRRALQLPRHLRPRLSHSETVRL